VADEDADMADDEEEFIALYSLGRSINAVDFAALPEDKMEASAEVPLEARRLLSRQKKELEWFQELQFAKKFSRQRPQLSNNIRSLPS
jgi:hypothetical protein